MVRVFYREISPETPHLLSQSPAIVKGNIQLLLRLSWIKKYIYSLWTHTGELLHNGI